MGNKQTFYLKEKITFRDKDPQVSIHANKIFVHQNILYIKDYDDFYLFNIYNYKLFSHEYEKSIDNPALFIKATKSYFFKYSNTNFIFSENEGKIYNDFFRNEQTSFLKKHKAYYLDKTEIMKNGQFILLEFVHSSGKNEIILYEKVDSRYQSIFKLKEMFRAKSLLEFNNKEYIIGRDNNLYYIDLENAELVDPKINVPCSTNSFLNMIKLNENTILISQNIHEECSIIAFDTNKNSFNILDLKFNKKKKKIKDVIVFKENNILVIFETDDNQIIKDFQKKTERFTPRYWDEFFNSPFNHIMSNKEENYNKNVFNQYVVSYIYDEEKREVNEPEILFITDDVLYKMCKVNDNELAIIADATLLILGRKVD